MPPVVAEVAGFLRGLETLSGGVVNAAHLAVRDGIRAAEESAKATTLFADRSGKTRGSIRGQYDGFGRGAVTFGGLSRLLDSGTRPHIIRGKPMLRFEVAGEVFYRRLVHHPGTAERPFVREAVDRARQVVDYAAPFYIGEAIRRAR